MQMPNWRAPCEFCPSSLTSILGCHTVLHNPVDSYFPRSLNHPVSILMFRDFALIKILQKAFR